MYKRALITDEVSQDFEVALNLAKEFRLEGVEIRSVWEKGPDEFSSDDVSRIKSFLEGCGLEVCCIATPFLKCDIENREEYEQHLEILEKSVRLAESLGTTILRGFTFWRRAPLEKYWDGIVDLYERPIKMLQEYGMTLGIENEGSTMIGTGRTLAQFLEQIDHPNVKAVWDPMNSWGFSVENPGLGEEPLEGYEALKNFIVHIHVKDAVKVDSETRAAPLGEGSVGIQSQLEAFQTDRYGRYVSLETHYRVVKALESDVARLPKGSRFSAGGLEGSRICLQNWVRIEEAIRKKT